VPNEVPGAGWQERAWERGRAGTSAFGSRGVRKIHRRAPTEGLRHGGVEWIGVRRSGATGAWPPGFDKAPLGFDMAQPKGFGEYVERKDSFDVSSLNRRGKATGFR
jgi:hypothetical protein